MLTPARRLALFLGLAGLLALIGHASAQTPTAAKRETTADRIDFKATVLAEDPFAPVNQVGVVKKEFRRGEVVRLVISGTPRPGFHTYPVAQRTASQPEPMSTIRFTDVPGLRPLFPLHETQPEFVDTKIASAGVWLEYAHPFVWWQDVIILPDAPPGPMKLPFVVRVQVCNEKSCLWGEHPLEVAFTLSDADPLPLTVELKQRMEVKPSVAVVELPGTPVPSTEEKKAAKASKKPSIFGAPTNDSSLLSAMSLAFFAAVAMLFTPCVFPMIPITVSFFLKQSEKGKQNALVSASVYALTIIVVLALSVLVLGKIIVELANNAWVNLALGLVLVFFALSLFGMYEIELPSFISQFTSSREGKGGYAGTFFMALTFTVTSFTCTGPFLGPLLVGAKVLQLNLLQLFIVSLTYAATFAAPFFVLALFPGLLKKLPKSGSWLNSVKVVMGFLELAAALKFLANTDVGLNPGSPMFFNYETVLCAWIALSVACGAYLFGAYRLPHDSPVESIGVFRMLLATLFFALAMYMAPALWRERPIGVVGEGLVAFLPLDTRARASNNGNGGASADLDWHMDYEMAWAEAVKDNKLIFIDFTGVNCTNCRDNEQNVFPRPEVRKAMERFVRVQLYTDSVPRAGLSREQALAEAQRNSEWEEATFEDLATPLYVVFKPAKDKPFVDGRLNGTTLFKVGGKIPKDEIASFVQGLQAPLNGAVAQAK